MMEYSSAILSNKSLQLFMRECQNNLLSHAYLVVASDSTSLPRILTAMSAIILCKTHSLCMTCLDCQKVLSNNHTNIHTFGNNNAPLTVDIAQNIIKSMARFDIEESKSVYIIDGADRMSEIAQNKLLKTIEEPPDHAVILLGVVSENALLPTLRSRVKTLYINLWNTNTLNEQLTAQSPQLISTSQPISQVEFASDMSAGSLARATELLADDNLYARYLSVFDMLITLRTSSDVLNYLDIFGKDSESCRTSMSMLEVIFSKALHSHIAKMPNAIANCYSYNAIVNIQELIIEQYRKLKANCSVASVTNALIMGMLEIRYKTK